MYGVIRVEKRRPEEIQEGRIRRRVMCIQRRKD